MAGLPERFHTEEVPFPLQPLDDAMQNDATNTADENAIPGLVVLWTTGDPETATLMALMYAKNSRLKGWWDQVRLVVWGPSAKLLAENPDIQAEVEDCMAAGVRVEACRRCAERYGVAEAIEGLGIDVLFMGEPMTHYLKSGWKVLSI